MLLSFLLLSFLAGSIYYFTLEKTKKNVYRSLIFICVIPSVFNVFFVTNHLFSSNKQVETYSFVHKREHYRGGYKKVSSILLEDHRYDKHTWFTVFFDFESMEYKNEIEYHFEDGLWGIRVLKDYRFTK